ncbi:hypothetical protein ACWDV7_27175 [Streptomyces sp. NPDC003362]
MKDKFQDQAEQWQQQARDKMGQAKEPGQNRRGQRREDEPTPPREREREQERLDDDYDA